MRLLDGRVAVAELRFGRAALAEEVADEDEVADVAKLVLELGLRAGAGGDWVRGKLAVLILSAPSISGVCGEASSVLVRPA